MVRRLVQPAGMGRGAAVDSRLIRRAAAGTGPVWRLFGALGPDWQSALEGLGGGRPDIHFAIGESSLGLFAVAVSPIGVCAILFGDDRSTVIMDLHDLYPLATPIYDWDERAFLLARIEALIDNPSDGLDMPLDLRGRAFQRRVWRELMTVPAGETITEQVLATRLGRRTAVRAVRAACAANRIAVAIPCHRVVGDTPGRLGYRWGAGRQRTLLRREAVEAPPDG